MDGRRLSGRFRRRLGIAARLPLSISAVITIGAGTLLIVALLIAPVIFHDHLQRGVTDLSR